MYCWGYNSFICHLISLQLEQLIFRDFRNVSSDYSIWEDVYRTMQSLVTGIENLQKGTIYAEGSEPWLYILLQQLLRLVSYSNRYIVCVVLCLCISATGLYSERSMGVFVCVWRGLRGVVPAHASTHICFHVENVFL